MNMKIIW